MIIEVRNLKARPEKKAESSTVTSKQNVTVSSASTILTKSRSINSPLKRKGFKDSTGQFLLFVAKVVALEAIRRGSQGKCRPIWWGLQGLSVFQAPPFSWFQRWAPFRILAHATESFSKPLICLSVATVVASAYKESRQENPVVAGTAPAADLAITNVRTGEGKEEEILVTDLHDKQALSLEVLKHELERNGVILTERMDDDELERFGVAANGDMSKFVATMKKTVQWRKTYHFLPESDLQSWSHLVFWHLHDAQGRPTLVIRLGAAYSTIAPSDRPRFAQAVVSQVEHGLQNMVLKEDGRLTVVMDCRGTSFVGFPLHMMKSCSVLVQENYPTRLAALFVINLPPVVRILAKAIMKVVKPSTQEKVHMEGDGYMNNLATHVGGIFNVPVVLGGKCSCDFCDKVQTLNVTSDMSLVAHRARAEFEQLGHQELALEERAYSARLSMYQSYSGTLRLLIGGLFLLWILVSMLSRYYDNHIPPT